MKPVEEVERLRLPHDPVADLDEQVHTVRLDKVPMITMPVTEVKSERYPRLDSFEQADDASQDELFDSESNNGLKSAITGLPSFRF